MKHSASSRTYHQPTPARDSPVSGDDTQNVIFPRRKAGQSKKSGGKAGVVVTLEVLEQVFDMPLHRACKTLGVCATAFKKVCRKLGVMKWPYKDSHMPPKRKAAARRNQKPESPHAASLDSASYSDASTEVAETSPEPETPRAAHRKAPEVELEDEDEEIEREDEEVQTEDSAEENAVDAPVKTEAEEDEELQPEYKAAETEAVTGENFVEVEPSPELLAMYHDNERMAQDPMEFFAADSLRSEDACAFALADKQCQQIKGEPVEMGFFYHGDESIEDLFGKDTWQSSFAPSMCDILRS
eukprot:CAMPEP_0181315290 /NCGR_PEP_ID=MMETSP1101-20121128/15293_1 /TAXON_ID=46948 /ORGANISM="Rhodomonas abbreviata, Strain Caron Lab Isolate" /LENGTH=298 /DNA_ID=CAMNT_0023422481 /DNA_START=172 /DNA_END=1068 /DNA_ORIENTATION=-